MRWRSIYQKNRWSRLPTRSQDAERDVLKLDRIVGESAPGTPWPQSLTRSACLASSLDAATHPNGARKAGKLAEKAYWDEFEGSGMETAVRLHLGFARAGDLERCFRDVRAAIRGLSEGKQTAADVAGLTRKLLLALVQTASELNRKGVTDGTQARVHLALAPSSMPMGAETSVPRLSSSSVVSPTSASAGRSWRERRCLHRR